MTHGKKWTEVQRLRALHDWENVESALKKYRATKGEDTFVKLVMGELALRSGEASEAEAVFLEVLDVEKKNKEAKVLLSIAMSAQERLEDAIDIMDSVSVEGDISRVEACRFLEGLRVKGENLEKVGRTDEALAVYEECVALSQRTADKKAPLASIIREASLAWYLQADLHSRNDNLPACLNILRGMISFDLGLDNEIKKGALLMYGDALLHRCSSSSYPAPEKDKGSDSTPLPKDEVEEALVAYLQLELESRPIVDDEATLVFDNLCLAYCRRYSVADCIEAYERSLALRFEDHHLWFQFAFALVGAEKYHRALFVIRECISLEPTNPVMLLLAAKICINELNLPKDAKAFAESAVRHGGIYLPRCYQTLGVACGMVAETLLSNEERRNMQLEALTALQKAFSLDPNDGTIMFHLARQYADIRETDKALTLIQSALKRNAELAAGAWCLLALLLSAKTDLKSALSACELGLQKNQNDIKLLLTKAKIEKSLGSPRAALQTYKQAFSAMARRLNSSGSTYAAVDEAARAPEEGERDSFGTFRRISVADFSPSGGGQDANARRASTMYSTTLVANSAAKEESHFNAASAEFTDMWVAVSDAFVSMEQFDQAKQCLALATGSDSPLLAPSVLYQEGLLKEMTGDLASAKEIYEEVLSVGSNHCPTLIRLGGIYRDHDANLVIAENTLNTAVRTDPTNHDAWFQLGLVLKGKGELERASECFQTAMELEETAPLLSYATVRRRI